MLQSDNCISKAWNFIKTKYNEYCLENKIADEFEKKNTGFTIYKNGSILSNSVSGYISNNQIVIYGSHLNCNKSIIVNETNKKKYYINDSKTIDLKIEYDNVEYVRKGTLLYIDSFVEEVEAIKVGKKYYRHVEK